MTTLPELQKPSAYVLANETPWMRENRLQLEANLVEYRRYQKTPEYRAAEAEKERIREEHRREWLAWAASGWPASRNLVEALGRK